MSNLWFYLYLKIYAILCPILSSDYKAPDNYVTYHFPDINISKFEAYLVGGLLVAGSGLVSEVTDQQSPITTRYDHSHIPETHRQLHGLLLLLLVDGGTHSPSAHLHPSSAQPHSYIRQPDCQLE